MSETLSVALQKSILRELLETGGVNTISFAVKLGATHDEIIEAVTSLQLYHRLLKTEEATVKKVELTAEGKEMALNGSAECRVFQAVGAEGMLQDDLKKESYGKVGLSKALAAGWVSVVNSGDGVRVVRKIVTLESDAIGEALRTITESNGRPKLEEQLKCELIERKLINESWINGLNLSRGTEFHEDFGDLTSPEMIIRNRTVARCNEYDYKLTKREILDSATDLHLLVSSLNFKKIVSEDAAQIQTLVLKALADVRNLCKTTKVKQSDVSVTKCGVQVRGLATYAEELTASQATYSYLSQVVQKLLKMKVEVNGKSDETLEQTQLQAQIRTALAEMTIKLEGSLNEGDGEKK